MEEQLPALLNGEKYPALIQVELDFLSQARKLLDSGFPDHALLDIWNASVHNLRRRVEAYGVELFLSSVKDEPGRKKYNKDGETINERWGGVDEFILISGTTRLGVLNKKAGKSLEMINWMRNHASPAHASDDRVEREDVFGLALILQKNLFESPLPDPGHSPSGLFDPIKSATLDEEKLGLLRDQINSFRTADIRLTFGFMVDIICKGEDPAFENVKPLFGDVWSKADDDLRKSSGSRYHSFVLDPDSDDSSDKGARVRLLETLVSCHGIKYIPDAARASLYRHAVKPLSRAKDESYGWADEVKSAKSLSQFGPHVPSIAFEEIYQEILAVWFGNYWGRSDAYIELEPFIKSLNTTNLIRLARMMIENERSSNELFQSKPKSQAIDLLRWIKTKLTIQANIDEIDSISDKIKEI